MRREREGTQILRRQNSKVKTSYEKRKGKYGG